MMTNNFASWKNLTLAKKGSSKETNSLEDPFLAKTAEYKRILKNSQNLTRNQRKNTRKILNKEKQKHILWMKYVGM